ncbi:hypothetical protein ACFYY8_34665 [Streptosporangium sp. NPDC001559]|uniref:hypothetical protein n=1 Tax=Streptosporangium sp. NPDC001559 TaxID=3366187 RepID=UPI0036E50AC8
MTRPSAWVAVWVAACGALAATPAPPTAPATATPTATPTTAPTTARPAVPPGTVPQGFKRVGGPANGLTLALPQDWAALDLSRDDLDKSLTALGLSGEALEQARRSLRPLVANKAVWASDRASAATSPNRFATNLNAFCQESPDVPADQIVADVRRQLGQLGATISQAGEVPIEDGTAVRVVYRLPSRGIDIKGTQYYTRSSSSGRTCILTLSTDKDGLQPLFDRIGRTLTPR